jgi:integrase
LQATLRSYGMDLLRWFRFVWAVECPWDQATRAEARDFSRWVQLAGKVQRAHWRQAVSQSRADQVAAGSAGEPALAEGMPLPGRPYAAATVAHSETVLRGFYDFHREAGSGPVVNPFPLARQRHRGGRPHAHHNPLQPFRRERSGLYRPKITRRVPRCIPDEKFNELFAGLRSHRDRALVALYVSTGARAAELLGVMNGDVDAGQQLITVVRKGSRRMQQVPASPDAFVWLRLYQAQMQGQVPAGRDDPLWWTLRRPFRPLSYHAVYQLLGRVARELGAHWSLHDLRHTAAYRMARDPELPLTDIILSFRVSRGCDLRRLVVDSVLDGTAAA